MIRYLNIDSALLERYTVSAPYKAGAGIGVLKFAHAHNRASAVFLRTFPHIQIMVGRAGASKDAPGSCATGYANPVRLTTSVIGVPCGEFSKFAHEDVTMATTLTQTHPKIDVIHGKAVTSSLAVAEYFCKQHKNVIQKIQTLECSVEFTELNFQPSDYTDCTGRKLPCYQITRDGFAFLAMGFTGKRAARFKEAYINAFNLMEKSLSGADASDTGRKTWVKSSLEHYVAALRRNAALRDAEKTLTEALQKLRDAHTCEAAEDALKDAQNMMVSLSTEKGIIQPVHIDDVLPEVVDRVECRNQGLEKSRTLMTGIDELDAKTGGMEPGDLIFIAARPSMGKTELALDIIDKVTEQGRGVLLFTMEMANIQIGERMVSAAGGMPVSRLKSVSNFGDEDWARFIKGVELMTGRNIWMVDQANLTIDEICATTKHHLIKHPETALVVVDYLGLIKTRTTGRHDLAVGEISKGLKGLAKSGGFPLIALSQLSRSVESRPNKRPMNSDLKNSGEIEADADIILMLYRDEVYNPDTQARGIAEINITKQRNGSLGTIYRRFYNGHFLPVDQESAQVLSTPMQPSRPRRYSNKRTDSSKMERFF